MDTGPVPANTEAPANEVKTEAVVTPEAPKAPEPPKEKDSARFLALSKREKALQKQREELQKLKAENDQKHQAVTEWEKLKAEAKLNPMKALEVLGVSYEQLTDNVLNDGKPTPSAEVEAVRAELNKFKQAQEDERKANAAKAIEETKAQEAKLIAQFKDELADFVDKEKDTYELISLYEAQDLVFETIQEHWTKQIADKVPNPTILSNKEAAELVENYLFDYAKKLSATKKFKALASPSQETEVVDDKAADSPVVPAASQQKAEPKAKAYNATPSLTAAAKTEQDRIKRALAALGH